MTPTETQRAVFSDCRTYRYELWRVWDESLPYVAFIGLNPSTADETKDDPTIRKCRHFAKAWGYGGFVMLNLFPFRATDPRELKKAKQPYGELYMPRGGVYWWSNTKRIVEHVRASGLIVAAWGVDGAHRNKAWNLMNFLTQHSMGPRIHCLGTNNDGSPKHPLYLANETKPVPYGEAWRKGA
jgi:hypothetical protein